RSLQAAEEVPSGFARVSLDWPMLHRNIEGGGGVAMACGRLIGMRVYEAPRRRFGGVRPGAAIRRAAATLVLAAAAAPALAQDAIIGTATLPRDLSPWGMYLNADPVVKAVLIGLAFASLLTWTVWLAKTAEIIVAKRRVRAALQVLAGARSIAEAVERLRGSGGEVRSFLDAAVAEPELSRGAAGKEGNKGRNAAALRTGRSRRRRRQPAPPRGPGHPRRRPAAAR